MENICFLEHKPDQWQQHERSHLLSPSFFARSLARSLLLRFSFLSVGFSRLPSVGLLGYCGRSKSTNRNAANILYVSVNSARCFLTSKDEMKISAEQQQMNVSYRKCRFFQTFGWMVIIFSVSFLIFTDQYKTHIHTSAKTHVTSTRDDDVDLSDASEMTIVLLFSCLISNRISQSPKQKNEQISVSLCSNDKRPFTDHIVSFAVGFFLLLLLFLGLFLGSALLGISCGCCRCCSTGSCGTGSREAWEFLCSFLDDLLDGFAFAWIDHFLSFGLVALDTDASKNLGDVGDIRSGIAS